MRTSTVLAALATAVAASPAPPQYHTISFTVLNNSTIVTANLLQASTKGHYVLQAERPSVYQGSQAFFTGNDTINTDGLIFLPNSYTTAGAAVPRVGNKSGFAAPITVTEGSNGDQEWGYDRSTGTLSHKLDAASERFFACATTVNGKNATVLSWGVPQKSAKGLEAPKGCEYTSVYVGAYNSQSA